MARKVRIQCPGAVYHVLCRGDHQEAMYRDDADRELFLRCLEEAWEETGWLIQVISTYIHLDPVRAGLIRGEGEPLKA